MKVKSVNGKGNGEKEIPNNIPDNIKSNLSNLFSFFCSEVNGS